MESAALLATIGGYVEAASDGRGLRLATITEDYSDEQLPTVIFDGESVPSSRRFPYLSPYLPFPGDRVVLVPVGTSYVIAGCVSSERPTPVDIKYTTAITPIVPNTSLDIITTTIRTVAGRSYELDVSFNGFAVTPATALGSAVVNVAMRRNGTVLQGLRVLPGATTKTQMGNGFKITDTPGGGLTTFAFRLNHESTSTATNVTISCGSTTPIALLIKECV